MSGAARELRFSPAAVSQQVGALERQVGALPAALSRFARRHPSVRVAVTEDDAVPSAEGSRRLRGDGGELEPGPSVKRRLTQPSPTPVAVGTGAGHAGGMPPLEFAIVDVFADEPLSGNPLAVVAGGESLSDDVLGRVAREFNQSETTFVMPSPAGATRRLRSFTAGGAEVTGAGHNSLGAWWWLVAGGRERAGTLTQELGADVLDVDARERDGRIVVRLRQAPAALGAIGEMRAELASALGLSAGELVRETAPVVSTGTPHLLVEAADPGAVDRAGPDAPALAAQLARVGAQGCYLFALTGRAGADAYARFFNPTVGLWEDPATGSAACPLAWTLANDGGRRTVTIEQGHAMGRPSRIEVEVDGDEVTLVGSAVLVAEGRLDLTGSS